MQLFDKIYGCYYQVAAKIIEEASKKPITRHRMQELADTYGYEESALAILPRLLEGRWPFLRDNQDGTWSGILAHVPKTPITILQKEWLKAITLDPRTQLFFSDEELLSLQDQLKEITPLYHVNDFYHYDRYLDGDNYSCEEYRRNFQTILRALGKESFLFVSYAGKRDSDSHVYEVYPDHLQYSSKDDKFRLYGFQLQKNGRLQPVIMNLGRILGCHLSKTKKPAYLPKKKHQVKEPVRIEISGQRNSLERCMLHFANYEKHTEYKEEQNVYHCSIYYNPEDETELLIQILSFGPVIRVLGPDDFLSQIKERMLKQFELFHRPS